MEATKLTIDKETMAMATKPLNTKKKGELRMERLKQLADSGKLAMIKTRGDLAEAVGYTYQQRHSLGYQWVHYRIKKGVIKETLTGYRNGMPEYEYELIGHEPAVKIQQQPQVIINEDQKQAAITIYHGDTTIALENINDNTIIEIVKAITKGE